MIRQMSFWKLVFRKCLLGFVHFCRKYIWEMSAYEHAMEVLTVNLARHSVGMVWYGMVYRSEEKSIVHFAQYEKSYKQQHKLFITALITVGVPYARPPPASITFSHRFATCRHPAQRARNFPASASSMISLTSEHREQTLFAEIYCAYSIPFNDLALAHLEIWWQTLQKLSCNHRIVCNRQLVTTCVVLTQTCIVHSSPFFVHIRRLDIANYNILLTLATPYYLASCCRHATQNNVKEEWRNFSRMRKHTATNDFCSPVQ